MTEQAMNPETPARYVATELDKAPGGALSISELAAGYRHPNPGDESRVPAGKNVNEWLLEQGIAKMGAQIELGADGLYRLTKPFDKLRFNRKVMHRLVDNAGQTSAEAHLLAIRHVASQPFFTVDVQGAKSVKSMRVRLHPLASWLPWMGDKDFSSFIASVEEQGVLEPIVVRTGPDGPEVLDGRHRLLAAYQLRLPVRLVEPDWAGADESVLREKLFALNAHRRQLTAAQRTLLVAQVHLPAEREAAKQRRVSTLKQNQAAETVPPILAERFAGDSVVLAVRKSGLQVSTGSLKKLVASGIDNAPTTQQRIMRGELKTVAAAETAARIETGSTQQPVPREELTVYALLGKMQRSLNQIEDVIDQGDPGRVGKATPGEVLARWKQFLKSAADADDRITAYLIGDEQ